MSNLRQQVASTDFHRMTGLLRPSFAEKGIIGKTRPSLWGLQSFKVGDASTFGAMMVVFVSIKAYTFYFIFGRFSPHTSGALVCAKSAAPQHQVKNLRASA